MSALDQAGSTYSRLILYCIQCVGAFGVYYIIISFVLFVIVFFSNSSPFQAFSHIGICLFSNI